MALIHELPEHIVNKIAAGEVIERPASVVKELVENALDASAARVRIEVEEGGKKSIRVTDDGVGIEADDLPLAFKGHATSKLLTVEELEQIATLGFRGEALASIASVSMATIRSRRREFEHGARLECFGGKLGEVTACGAPPGTSVDVANLFFNTPARRKFLKASSTEMGHITESISRLALSHENVGFELTHGKRRVIAIEPSATTEARIGAVAGREVMSQLLPILPLEVSDIRVSGFLLPPEKARARSSGQSVFLNSRFIRDRTILHAASSGYSEYLIPGRYPVFYLYLAMDPATFDINVHPTKVEVRFADGRAVHHAVHQAVRKTLECADLTRRVFLVREPQVDVEPHVEPHVKPHVEVEAPTGERRTYASEPSLPSDGRETHPFSSTTGLRRADVVVAVSEPPHRSVEQQVIEEALNETPRFLQIHNSFIVEETSEGLRIHDQHALHERILHDEILTRLKDGPIPSQALLVPELIDLGVAEVEAILVHDEALARLGVRAEAFGGPTLAVHAVPALSSRIRVEVFLRDLLCRIEEHGGSSGGLSKEEVLSRAIDTAACKAAVKNGDRLEPEEVEGLLTRVRRVPHETQTCVHGRPTRIEFGLADLNRWFERR